jgi:hypothetical protein
MSSQSPQNYRVIWTVHAQQNVAALRDIAVSESPQAASELATKLRKILEALSWVPLDWGEAYLELEQIHMTLFAGYLDKLAVNYGVDEFNRIVYVRQVKQL